MTKAEKRLTIQTKIQKMQAEPRKYLNTDEDMHTLYQLYFDLTENDLLGMSVDAAHDYILANNFDNWTIWEDGQLTRQNDALFQVRCGSSIHVRLALGIVIAVYCSNGRFAYGTKE